MVDNQEGGGHLGSDGSNSIERRSGSDFGDGDKNEAIFLINT